MGVIMQRYIIECVGIVLGLTFLYAGAMGLIANALGLLGAFR